jgi:hypothetical protein
MRIIPSGMPRPRPIFAEELRPLEAWVNDVADAELIGENVGEVCVGFDEDCEALADADADAAADEIVLDANVDSDAPFAGMLAAELCVSACVAVVTVFPAAVDVAAVCPVVEVAERTTPPPPPPEEAVALLPSGSWRSRSRSSIPRKSLN